MKLTERNLTEDDFEEVLAMWKRACLWTYPAVETEKKHYLSLLRTNPRDSWCIVHPEDGIVATGMGGFDGWMAFAYRVATDPRYRNRGLGARAVALVDQSLRARGAEHVFLRVYVGNKEVIPFYEKLGFAEDDTVLMKKL
jgi:ribosomal protein S18 acetylase RimI-like enzyme